MIAETLAEAVSQILGKKITEGEAMHFIHKNYMVFRMFTRYEDKIVSEKKIKQKNKSTRRRLTQIPKNK